MSEALMQVGLGYVGDSAANHALARFPGHIYGASGVAKYAAPNASHCLVHIKQVHDHDDMTESDRLLIEACQQEVYSILSFLIEKHGLREVRLEGVTARTELLENLLGSWEHQRNITGLTAVQLVEREMNALMTPEDPVVRDAFLYAAGADPSFLASRRVQLEEELKFARSADETLLPERRTLVNAVYRLNAEGRLRIRQGDDDELSTLAEAAVDAGGDYRAHHEPREDALLRIIAASKEALSVTVFGGEHDWKPNINQWNSGHEGRFSLIEVTPETTALYLEELARKGQQG
ncbi:hypothetical protein HY642_06640 [Candidatus Woesearchaeota archaeon]|nr:hypothetical protein [Candidatus Woesearchaeota archaeon]